MISFSKILLLIAIICVVWYGYKIIDRRGLAGIFGTAKDQRRPPNPAKPRALDMHKCNRCGDYVAPDARACGRGDCPYPAA
jgi:hypothetical protein